MYIWIRIYYTYMYIYPGTQISSKYLLCITNYHKLKSCCFFFKYTFLSHSFGGWGIGTWISISVCLTKLPARCQPGLGSGVWNGEGFASKHFSVGRLQFFVGCQLGASVPCWLRWLSSVSCFGPLHIVNCFIKGNKGEIK